MRVSHLHPFKAWILEWHNSNSAVIELHKTRKLTPIKYKIWDTSSRFLLGSLTQEGHCAFTYISNSQFTRLVLQRPWFIGGDSEICENPVLLRNIIIKLVMFLSIEKQPHYPDDTSHPFWLIWKVQKLEVWTAQKTSALVTLALAPFTNSNALKSPENKFSFCQVDVEREHAFEISPTFHF